MEMKLKKLLEILQPISQMAGDVECQPVEFSGDNEMEMCGSFRSIRIEYAADGSVESIDFMVGGRS